jgi:hypothetical protein
MYQGFVLAAHRFCNQFMWDFVWNFLLRDSGRSSYYARCCSLVILGQVVMGFDGSASLSVIWDWSGKLNLRPNLCWFDGDDFLRARLDGVLIP